MILQELYKKDITRNVNPAVSAGDLDETTIKTEIEEYVFTDEIVQGLYDVISGIKDANTSHNGIWISGYYGSGKSHFLKYLNYCLSPNHGQRALERLSEQVQKKSDDISMVTPKEITDIKRWISTAQVNTILFNIGTVHNSNSNGYNTFVEVFWNEFNKFRGFNQFNLSLAQYLEKPLSEAGVFDDFKKEIQNQGFDWVIEASDLANTELDFVLETAQKFLPSLSLDAIRERIVKNDFHISVEKLKNEMTKYIAKLPDNYRLLFFVDEVSQFINNRQELLLQLQEIVTGLHDASNGKIWVACTAQQDLSEIVSASHISQTTDDYGKIMGRFEVKVSLGKTAPEYITKVRLLEKNGNGEMELNKIYKSNRVALETQFRLPSGYSAYSTQEDFTDFYPFIPYQFRLIMQVLDNFVNLQYVDKEKKGTERSIIKITHSAAKESMNQQLGYLIPFDKFYNAVLSDGLTHIGQHSLSNAINTIAEYDDAIFGRRVVNILFMICHMSDADKIVFPATVENIVNLMMTKVDDDLRPLKDKIVAVLDFLANNNIIRCERTDSGVEYYNFYTEDEREVAKLIDSQNVDDVTFADELKAIIETYVGAIQPKKLYYSRNVSIGMKISGRQYLTTNNPDIWINLMFECPTDENMITLQNEQKQLIFYMDHLFRTSSVRDEFYKYCKTQKYLKENNSGNEARMKANDEFRSRAAAAKKNIIDAFKSILDESIIISGQSKESGLSNRGRDRLDNALDIHLSNLYPYAKFASGNAFPASNSDLAAKIRRPLDENEYSSLNPMNAAEQYIDQYLDRMSMTTRDIPKVIANFEGAPYGWSKIFTVYILNELVRRRKWAFSYNNVKNPNAALVADRIMTETAKFTMECADAIPSDLVRQFAQIWDEIFGKVSTFSTTDAYAIFEQAKNYISNAINVNDGLYHNLETYPCKDNLYALLTIIKHWNEERDIVTFFKAVIDVKDQAKELLDKRKQLQQFYDDHIKNRGGYVKIREYVSTNKDNFEHLIGTDKTEAQSLQQILTDTWPIDNMRSYGKSQKTVETAIKSIKDYYSEQIRTAYNQTYEQLKSYAQSVGVDISVITPADRQIGNILLSDNLDRLKAAVGTTSYYEQNVQLINSHIKTDSKPVTLKIKSRTDRALCNESDVNEYLDTIKKQIMSHIDNGEQVTII